MDLPMTEPDRYRVEHSGGVVVLPEFRIDPDADDWMQRGISVVSWGLMTKRFRTYASSVHDGRVPPSGVRLPVVLIPRPDNVHDSYAISVAVPASADPGDLDHRTVGYIRSGFLWPLHKAGVSSLARYSGWEILCTALYRGAENVKLALPMSDVLARATEEFTSIAGPPPLPPAVTFRHPQTQEFLSQIRRFEGRAAQVSQLSIATSPSAGDIADAGRDGATPTTLVVEDAHTGAKLGEWWDGVLACDDERQRGVVADLLRAEGVPVLAPRMSTTDNDAPNLRAAWGVGGFRILAPRPPIENEYRHLRSTARSHRTIARYNARTGVLWVEDMPFKSSCRVFLDRLGLRVAETRQSPWPWQLDDIVDETHTHDVRVRDAHSPVRQQPVHVLRAVRSLLPQSHLLAEEIEWVDPGLRLQHGPHQMTYERFIRERDGLFGTTSFQGTVGACRLCGASAATFTTPASSQELAYCQGCLRRAAKGLDAPRETAAAALALISELEFDGQPLLEAQLDHLHIDPAAPRPAEEIDRLLLLRFGIRRGSFPWTHVLLGAGLVDDGLRMARGTVVPARDGHLCLSLREKVVDDFLHQHQISHEREPLYPQDPAINPRGRFRADWVLADGTFVELWGLPDSPKYAIRMAEKRELAGRYGIRLVEVFEADLPLLPAVFAEWLLPDNDGSWNWSPLMVTDPRTTMQRRIPRPDPDAPGGGAYHAEAREDRLARCKRAVELRAAGLSRAAIAEELGCGMDSVKALLRDGTFYGDPHADAVRRDLARDAYAAMTNGGTKVQFRAAEGLSTAKIQECWRDADVLFGVRGILVVAAEGGPQV